MANLKEVRNRITSVGSTMQITSAMKMVSAAKLKRAQDAITQMRPYANKLKDILQNLSASLNTSENAYARDTKGDNVLLIVISSNRGLAGAFNSNVIKKAWSMIRNEYKGSSKVSVLAVGKKANDAFKKTDHHIMGTDMPHNLNELFDNLNFDTVAGAAEKIMKAFEANQFDRVYLIYNQFKNAAVQLPVAERFLPIESHKPAAGTSKSKVDYIFEPSREYIVNELIPKSLKIQFYKAILDSVASEHGARMTAMHKATDNAKEMLRSLKISYNKARQAAITNEILEIVGGAEALNG
ncbi:MAG TPA: ATP synthase F1 subunit gamma [Bacteroidia bacterium]|jgi:F-type H+-transporting ATPase subunit gamma|nr:ATP synthase F1 subunit gamma [Bacteroidia bacterium]